MLCIRNSYLCLCSTIDGASAIDEASDIDGASNIDGASYHVWSKQKLKNTAGNAEACWECWGQRSWPRVELFYLMTILKNGANSMKCKLHLHYSLRS